MRRKGKSGMLVAILAGITVFLWGTVSEADVISTKGRTYMGTLEFVRQGDIEFEIDAVDDTVDIEIEDVTDLQTDDPRLVLYGNSGSVTGPLLGFEDGRLQVQAEPGAEGVIRVPVDEILSISDPADFRFGLFLRDHLRYWTGAIDIGVTATQATTDTSQFLVSLSGKREKGPTEINLSASYQYGRQRDRGADAETGSTTNLDQINGSASLRYDLFDSIFTFGEVQATYDAIQFLSLRTQPFGGVGYDIIDIDDDNLSVELGVGWVYESYFDGEEEDYAALSFGLKGEWDLPMDATFSGSIAYRPDVIAWAENYLIQAKADLSLPITSLLSFKFSVKNDYNNRPSEGAVPNSLYLNVALSITF